MATDSARLVDVRARTTDASGAAVEPTAVLRDEVRRFLLESARA